MGREAKGGGMGAASPLITARITSLCKHTNNRSAPCEALNSDCIVIYEERSYRRFSIRLKLFFRWNVFCTENYEEVQRMNTVAAISGIFLCTLFGAIAVISLHDKSGHDE